MVSLLVCHFIEVLCMMINNKIFQLFNWLVTVLTLVKETTGLFVTVGDPTGVKMVSCV